MKDHHVILVEVNVMSDLTYNKMMNQAVELYQRGEYLAAYDLVTRNASRVGGNPAQVFNFRFSFASRAGRPGLALYIMKEAVIDRGFWYSYDHLVSDDDLAPLRDLPEFMRMAEICKERERAAKEGSRPELSFVLPEAGSKEASTVLIALHGNEESALQAQAQWNNDGMSNCIMAFPQSSQVGFSDGYYWSDVEKGVIELKGHVRNIMDRFSLEGKEIILGGFSAGSGVVLHTLLDDELDVGGFVLVAPWLPNLDLVESRMDVLRHREVRGYVTYGERDEQCKGHATRLISMMDRAGVPHRSVGVPGLDHDFPDGFAHQVPNIISYLMERSDRS